MMNGSLKPVHVLPDRRKANLSILREDLEEIDRVALELNVTRSELLVYCFKTWFALYETTVDDG